MFFYSLIIESLPPYKFSTSSSQRERDQFKESDDESERSCGEKKNNNNKKKKKMGKRELAQIIAAQEWHDPTKWVSKKNKREEEVHTADEKKRKTNVLDSVKKVRKSTETRTKKTSAKQKQKTKNKNEETPSKSSKSTRDTTVVSVRSKSVTPASEEEKKDLEDDDPRTFDLLGNVGAAATGKKGGTLTSAEEKLAKRKDIDEEEKEEEKDAVSKEPETTSTTRVKVKEEEGSPPPPFPLRASAKKAPIVEKEKGENGVSHSPPKPTKVLDDEEKIKEDPVVSGSKETIVAVKKVSPPTLPTLVDHVKALEEGREELPILKSFLPVCFYCKTNSHCVETNGMSSLVECGRFAEDVNTKPIYAITSRFAEGTKERLAVEHALVHELSSFGKTKSKEEKFAHGTVTGAEEYEMEQKLTRPSSHTPTGVVIQDVAEKVAEKKQHRKKPAAEKKQSYTAKLQEFKRIRQVNQDNEDLGLFDAAATLSSFSIGMKTVSGNKSSGSGGSIKKMKNPSTPSAADDNNAAVAEEGKIEYTKTGRIKKAKKKYKKSLVGTLDPASERKRNYKEGVENFLKLATIRAHMKEPDYPNFLHRPASLRTKVEPDALTLFSGGKWRLVQGEDMAQANEAMQEESARQPPEENLSYEEALQRSKAEKEAKVLATQKGHEEDKKEDDEKSNPLREDTNLGAKDMMEKRGIQTAGEYAAVESKEDDATSKNPLEEESAKVRKVTDDDLPPGTKNVTKPRTREDRPLQTMVSTDTKTTKSSGSKSKYSTEGMKFQRVDAPPDYEKPILQPKRKRFANNPSFGITRAMIEQRFHMPLREAAKELGVGRTTFKRVLRLHGIERWPSQSLNAKKLTMKTITSLMSLPMSRMENNLDAQTLDSPSMNATLEDKERDEEQKKQMESLSNGIFTKNSNGTDGEGRPKIPNIALNNNIMNFMLNGAAAGISPEKSNLYSLGGNIAAGSQGNKSLKTSDLRGMSDLRNYNANVNALADDVTFGSLRGLSDNTFNNNNNNNNTRA